MSDPYLMSIPIKWMNANKVTQKTQYSVLVKFSLAGTSTLLSLGVACEVCCRCHVAGAAKRWNTLFPPFYPFPLRNLCHVVPRSNGFYAYENETKVLL